jgi:dCMP deaminase
MTLTWDQYYDRMAQAVAVRSSCSRRQVGAVIVVDNAIISTGYNGTPRGVPNCNEGGCLRCAGTAAPGESYDTCVCVHAEQNAILFAAHRGTPTKGGTIYCTLRPCFGCVKESIQAGIKEIAFIEPYVYPSADLEVQYTRLVALSGLIVRQI